MTLLVIARLLTFALTTLFSMAGVGAALILIPVFLAFGIELHTAMATALLLNAVGMTIASITFARKGLVEWRLVVPMLVLAVGLSPGWSSPLPAGPPSTLCCRWPSAP